jgi:hypothetical protein
MASKLEKEIRVNCEIIVRALLNKANIGDNISIQRDMGGNTLTVFFGQHHVHVGTIDGDFSKMVASLAHELQKERELQKDIDWNDPEVKKRIAKNRLDRLKLAQSRMDALRDSENITAEDLNTRIF